MSNYLQLHVSVSTHSHNPFGVTRTCFDFQNESSSPADIMTKYDVMLSQTNKAGSQVYRSDESDINIL